ncbi:MAG: hypothetical protein ACPG77_18810 [Nannocystaceae bacterium]
MNTEASKAQAFHPFGLLDLFVLHPYPSFRLFHLFLLFEYRSRSLLDSRLWTRR